MGEAKRRQETKRAKPRVQREVNATKATCRGMFRAEKRRATRTDQWWRNANERSRPFREAKAKAFAVIAAATALIRPTR